MGAGPARAGWRKHRPRSTLSLGRGKTAILNFLALKPRHALQVRPRCRAKDVGYTQLRGGGERGAESKGSLLIISLGRSFATYWSQDGREIPSLRIFV